MKVPDTESVTSRDGAYKDYTVKHYDAHHGVRPLSPLAPGDPVLVKTDEQSKWSTPARVVQAAPGASPRSYMVDTPTGVLRRNRRHLQACPESPRSNLGVTPENTKDTSANTQSAPVSTNVSTPEPRRSDRVRKPVQRLDL